MGATSLGLFDKLDTLEKMQEVLSAQSGEVAIKHIRESVTEDTFWHVRETLRQSYAALWGKACYTIVRIDGWYINPDHFLHVSVEDNTKVSYTPNAEKGRRDIQVRTTIGRYLKKFFPDASDDSIREASNQYANKYVPAELKFAMTADDIESVYEESPFGSCMKISHDHIRTPIHPVRAYASGDFAIAYCMNTEGIIAARAVCSLHTPNTPNDGGYYVRVYGHEAAIVDQLEKAGFSLNLSGFDGKRICAIEYDGRYVVPYLDGSVDGLSHGPNGFFTITNSSDGDYTATSSSGWADTADQCQCDDCGTACREEDMTWVGDDGDSLVCERCLDHNYIYAYVHINEHAYVSDGDAEHCRDTDANYSFSGRFSPDDVDLVRDDNGDLRHIDYVAMTVFEEYVDTDECISVGEDSYGCTLYSTDWNIRQYGSHYARHVETGEVVHIDDVKYMEWCELDDEGVMGQYILLSDERLEKERLEKEAVASVETPKCVKARVYPRPFPAGMVIRDAVLPDGFIVLDDSVYMHASSVRLIQSVKSGATLGHWSISPGAEIVSIPEEVDA